MIEAMINSMYALCEPWPKFLEGFHDFEVCIGGDGGSGSIGMASVIGLLFGRYVVVSHGSASWYSRS